MNLMFKTSKLKSLRLSIRSFEFNSMAQCMYMYRITKNEAIIKEVPRMVQLIEIYSICEILHNVGGMHPYIRQWPFLAAS